MCFYNFECFCVFFFNTLLSWQWRTPPCMPSAGRRLRSSLWVFTWRAWSPGCEVGLRGLAHLPVGVLSAGNSWGVWLVLRSHGWVSALALSSVSGPTLVVRVAEMPLLKFNFFSRKIKHAIFHGLGKPWDWYFCLSWCVILFCNNIPFVAI